ncbi:CsbD family protein [Streptomyces sp. NPDC049916]|uniref:CsbD family protein n=1 Tax=unclassified Streptomyces TaxID=2593676 RepID=UPI00343E3FFD
MDKIKGKGKEAVGKATGNRRLEAEGQADQAKGKVKGAADEVGDRAKGVTDSLRRDDEA